MKYLFILLILAGCATTPPPEPRTVHSDKNLRIMVDPDPVDSSQYVRVQNALMNENKWIVIERGEGFNATQKEQDREHREQHERFDNKEKWAHYGEMYGVGAIVVPHVECYKWEDMFGARRRKFCNQFLTLVDANTAQVIVSVQGQSKSPEHETPDWTDTVRDLANKYPKYFEEFKYTQRLQKYQEESKKKAEEQEIAVQRVIGEVSH